MDLLKLATQHFIGKLGANGGSLNEGTVASALGGLLGSSDGKIDLVGTTDGLVAGLAIFFVSESIRTNPGTGRGDLDEEAWQVLRGEFNTAFVGWALQVVLNEVCGQIDYGHAVILLCKMCLKEVGPETVSNLRAVSTVWRRVI